MTSTTTTTTTTESTTPKSKAQVKVKVLEEIPKNAFDLNDYLKARGSNQKNQQKNNFIKSYYGMLDNEETFKPKFRPALINGPFHLLNELVDKCYEFSNNKYDTDT